MATISRTDIRRKGYLYKLPATGGVIKIWSKRWVVLHCTTHEGVVRLEYYDNEECEIKGENKRVILLRNCSGCCETSEYKRTRPHTFRFTTNIGHHTFATDSKLDLDGWVDAINSAISEDKRKQKKRSKTKVAEEAEKLSSETSTSTTSSRSSIHPSTLIGVYHVTVVLNEFARSLHLSDNLYKLEVSPRGLRLVSTTSDTAVATVKYKHIRTYAKSGNERIIVTIGNRNDSGGGQLILQTSVTRELFSMIHRNIKVLRAAMEKARDSETQNEVEDITEKQKKKESESRLRRGMRSRSMSYELQPLPRQRSTMSDTSKHISCPPINEDVDLIQMEGFDNDQEFQDLQQFIDSLDPLLQKSSETDTTTSKPDSLEGLSSVILEVPTLPSSSSGFYDSAGPVVERFEDSFTSGEQPTSHTNTTDPFAHVTDPFIVPSQGSFYNSKEDIFQNFQDSRSPHKTSTPIHMTHSSSFDGGFSSNNSFTSNSISKLKPATTNPFKSSDVEQDIQDLHLASGNSDNIYVRPKKPPKNRMSKAEFDKVWDEITADLPSIP